MINNDCEWILLAKEFLSSSASRSSIIQKESLSKRCQHSKRSLLNYLYYLDQHAFNLYLYLRSASIPGVDASPIRPRSILHEWTFDPCDWSCVYLMIVKCAYICLYCVYDGMINSVRETAVFALQKRVLFTFRKSVSTFLISIYVKNNAEFHGILSVNSLWIISIKSSRWSRSMGIE